MERIKKESKIAIIGGGSVCKAILQILFSKYLRDQKPDILGVADIDDSAEGLQYAKDKGIYTVRDYKKLFKHKELNLIIELTKDENLRETIKKTKPPGVSFIDHFEAVLLWNFFQIEEAKTKFIRKLHNNKDDFEKIVELFRQFSNKFEKIIIERSDYSQKIRKELIESEKTMSQIIQGSTIPTFVINKDHIVTHWNKACEKLTGHMADEIVGTNKQWVPFRSGQRPAMADVIVDEMKVDDIKKYYGATWRKSDLIEGAYEAEEFFPNIGETGKWIFFTAAPIKSPDGKIFGAIETLWDKTEEKRVEQERERHNRELSALCSIYTALSTSLDLENRLHAAIQEIVNHISVDSICMFIQKTDGSFDLKYSYGISKNLCLKSDSTSKNSIINQVAQKGELTLFESIKPGDPNGIGIFAEEGLKSLAFIPLRAKEKKIFGVLRVGRKNFKKFFPEEKNVLELIGNRIGAAIENSILHEKFKKSEEKYRSLFNNDPNPIFIIDRKTFEILDVNKRAEECYEYSRNELLGKSFVDIGDKDDEELAEGLKIISKDESILFSKKRHYRKGKRPFFVNVNVCYAEYGGGYVLLATTTDISESIEKETQLIQASKMTTLGTMAAGMAHEINQPLNVIQVCADFFLKMIKKGKSISDEDLKSLANDISSSVQRASEIIKHMRDFARQSEVVKTKVNINDHQIELELDLDPELPCIMADHNRLEQVFINLVTNAVDAMDKKGDELGDMEWKRLLKIKSFSENGQAIVTVTDTGTGIPKEIIDKIFEPFFTTKEVGKGTGLGVSISYGIVKDYEGTIEIKSKVGKGTTFELRFAIFE